MYLVEINSEMIGIVFNKSCQFRNAFLVYSFSNPAQVDSTHIADYFLDITTLLLVWKYLFFTFNTLKKTRALECVQYFSI